MAATNGHFRFQIACSWLKTPFMEVRKTAEHDGVFHEDSLDVTNTTFASTLATAMAGFTGFSVGLCNNRMVFLPIPELVATSPRSMNSRGRTWERVLALTRQPNTVPPL